MRSLLLLLLLLIEVPNLQAQSVTTIGAGASASCGRWLDRRRTGHKDGMANWALGYISGAAVYGEIGDPLRDTDSDGVLYWLDNFLRQKPE